MGKKKPKHSLNIQVGDLDIMSLFFKENRDGFYHYASPRTGLHLTCLQKEDVLTAHISDESIEEGAMERKVWEMSISIKELEDGFIKSFNRAYKRYYWNEIIYVPSSEILNFLNELTTVSGLNNKIDIFSSLMRIIDFIKQGKFIYKMKARDVWNAGYKVGFTTSTTQVYFLIFIDNTHYLKFNVNPKKNFFQYIPFYMGMIEYQKRTSNHQNMQWKQLGGAESISYLHELGNTIASEVVGIENSLQNIDYSQPKKSK
jgi:hypothetical protein